MGGRNKRVEESSVNEIRREKGYYICVCVRMATGLLLCVNGSVEKGCFERQNKLMEAKGM